MLPAGSRCAGSERLEACVTGDAAGGTGDDRLGAEGAGDDRLGAGGASGAQLEPVMRLRPVLRVTQLGAGGTGGDWLGAEGAGDDRRHARILRISAQRKTYSGFCYLAGHSSPLPNMDTTSLIIMYLGFALATYSVVGNDVIQTLGTFLTSNERRPWYVLWAYAGTILAFVLIYGWVAYSGDVSYGKLIGNAAKGYSLENPAYPLPMPMSWWYLVPPVVLLFITRLGIPVSTTFLILSFFGTSALAGAGADLGVWGMTKAFFETDQFRSMLIKSLSGYAVAFGAAIVLYLLIAKAVEQRFQRNTLDHHPRERLYWTIAQWFSTGFLWSQWLIQDFANIYAYLPRQVSLMELIGSLVAILGLLAYIFYRRGGAIQGIVKSKTNTADIRSATLIDLTYGIVLYYFKELNDVPMSTTWVFIGLLAGRELAIQFRQHKHVPSKILGMVGQDLGKAGLGLMVSIILVIFIQMVRA
ncbi:MAG: hypothetical protein AAFR61_04695 [Bacteroidota bacterium]